MLHRRLRRQAVEREPGVGLDRAVEQAGAKGVALAVVGERGDDRAVEDAQRCGTRHASVYRRALRLLASLLAVGWVLYSPTQRDASLTESYQDSALRSRCAWPSPSRSSRPSASACRNACSAISGSEAAGRARISGALATTSRRDHPRH